MGLNGLSLIRRFSTNTNIKSKICIVGSGPAGFYAAEYLQRRLNPVDIDVYERFPVPFGLVRYGIAPDHPDLKKVMNSFTKTATKSNIRFFGNISLGKDVSLMQLQNAYHVVLLAYGAEESRKLNIPGENLEGVFPARDIVGWYTGAPANASLKIDLSNVQHVDVLGQGNVAVDVARILLSPIDRLRNTDITEYALEALSRSKVSEVCLIGRRGPIQAAFTTKELRELLKLEQCRSKWSASDMTGIAEIVADLPRPRKRLVELMLSSSCEPPNENCLRTFRPRFFLSPKAIKANDKKMGLEFTINSLVGDDLVKKRAVPTGQTLVETTDLVVTSIGYKSIQADENIPFDFENGVVKNFNGKVSKGLYSCGWVSSGPTGVLASTMNNAFRTADCIVKDIETEGLTSETKSGYNNIETILLAKNVQIVTWKDWLKINEYEVKEGTKLNKPREKIVDIKKMLEVAAL